VRWVSRAVPSAAVPEPRRDCKLEAATRLSGCGRPSPAIGSRMAWAVFGPGASATRLAGGVGAVVGLDYFSMHSAIGPHCRS
jgi:hypothetical protein